MSSTIPDPSWPRRLRHTPMRDVLRGRLTGRLDWRRAIAVSGLPRPVADVIARVVKQTRLWRTEQAEVASELIAHFADGLDADVDADTLVADFGDPRTAARLIARAKKRGRPLAWHVYRWAALGGVAGVFVYTAMAARFVLGRPSPTVDFLAPLNAPILATPVEDRAWPLYRPVIAKLFLHRRPGSERLPWYGRRDEVVWSAAKAWVDAHAADIEQLRNAAAKPHFGFILGPNGSAYDDGICKKRPPNPNDPFAGTIIGDTALPYLIPMSKIDTLFAVDARFAREAGDAARLRRDLHAMIGIARQLSDETGDTLVNSCAAIELHDNLHDEIERTLRQTPELLADADLVDLSHELAGPRTAADVLHCGGERAMALDVVQRIYTDDGHGDGRLTLRGLQLAAVLSGRADPSGRRESSIGDLALPALSAVYGSRRRAVERFEKEFAEGVGGFVRPLREQRSGLTGGAKHSLLDGVLKDDLGSLMMSFDGPQLKAEQMLAHRNGVLVGLATELYRRRHNGQWPTSLDELTPGLLPTVPADPVTGGPLKFKTENGRPLIYSVGGDGDDDGGRLPIGGDGKPIRAAAWPRTDPPDGDWRLFPQSDEFDPR